MNPKAACQRGFSLVELMVTISVMAILLAIALPSFRDVIHRNQVSTASNSLLASLDYARTEAINRSQIVSMCPGSAAAGCTAAGVAFEPGWIVYTYPAGAASSNKPYVAGTSIMLRSTTAQAGVSIQSKNTEVITFGMQGQLKSATASPKLVFVTCYRSGSTGTGSSTTAAPGVVLTVNGSGSVQSVALAVGSTCVPP
ncbi:MAG TPA: GspH/FimT family pseudopilin [Rhodanobacter sp.]